MLVDTHIHLDCYKPEELDDLITRAKKANVKALITQGTNHESNKKSLEIAKKYDIVHVAMGLYPLDAINVKNNTDYTSRQVNISVEETLDFIKKNKDKIVAIGEVGIDLKHSTDLKTQTDNFSKIIELAEKLKKPLIVHSRKAENEVLELLQSYNVKKIQLHVFEGRKKEIQKAADLGYYFSIPCIINKLVHFQMLTQMVNISQLLTETDGPWLSPYKEKQNEPIYIQETINHIAKIKKLDPKEVENIIYMNFQKLFRVPSNTP